MVYYCKTSCTFMIVQFINCDEVKLIYVDMATEVCPI